MEAGLLPSMAGAAATIAPGASAWEGAAMEAAALSTTAATAKPAARKNRFIRFQILCGLAIPRMRCLASPIAPPSRWRRPLMQAASLSFSLTRQ
jgi:hypothetical protein